MFTPVSMRSANAYRAVDIESSVLGSSPHQLVGLMFSKLLQTLASSKSAIQKGDTHAKVDAIGRSLRMLEEGLKGALDTHRGGEVAANLASLYDYCILRTTEANARNDAGMIDEVIALIKPVADGWEAIKSAPVAQSYRG